MTLNELASMITQLQARGLGDNYVAVEVNEDVPVSTSAILGVEHRGGSGVYICIAADDWGTEA